MEQQRRMILFFVLSFSAMYLWTNVGIRFFYPEFGKPKQEQVEKAPAEQGELTNGETPLDKNAPSKNDSEKEETNNQNVEPDHKPGEKLENPVAKKPAQADLKLPEFERKKVKLGKPGHDSKNFITVDLSSRGAVVTAIRLNDKRYPELGNRKEPLQILGEVPGSSHLSFDMRVKQVDRLLDKIEPGLNLELVDWEITEQAETKVTFRYPSPDGRLELIKSYQIKEGDLTRKDSDTDGYCLEVDLRFRNLSDRKIDLRYALQGPVGIPLENAENTRRYLAIQIGIWKDGEVHSENVSANTVVDQIVDQKLETFQAPLKYVGVDGQYFAALLIPQEDQQKNNWIEMTSPVLINKHKDEEKSLLSVILSSNELLIPAKPPGEKYSEVSHSYKLYAGPKRDSLLRPISADGIIEYGWFGSISKIMLAVMMFFHTNLYVPYGVAIILLTVTVRGLMFPISRKHAKAAKKMKQMQPRFEEIKKKYENDKEKLAKAQMELMKESGFFSGCLPMLLQLPIFIGLYQALYTSVDLRMSPFLWIENLAAPDHLMQLPFTIPWLGNFLNLLPLLTVGLFVVQQKLFAPPAANEEQAMQQKMMSYMMIVIGFMFYRVPAGLCVYFIASSMWAIAERKMLDFGTSDTDDSKPTAAPAVENKKKPDTEKPKKESWLQKKIEALDAAANPDKKATNTIHNSSKKTKKRKK